METLHEILSPAFRNSIYASLLVGVACPLMGVYLVLRRMVFLGVALPQISSAGVAFAFALPAWGVFTSWHATAGERALAFAGSFAFALAAVFCLAWSKRRGRTAIESQIGTAYVLAGAAGILLLTSNPHGEHGMLELLRGEIIAVPSRDLWPAAATFGVGCTLLLLFQKEFLLVSFDRDMAVTLGKRVFLWDLGLYGLMATNTSVAVLIVGPLVTFGLLLLPALLARQWARTMNGVLLLAALIGMGSAAAGFVIAWKLDWPVGPTDVMLLGCLLLLSSLVQAVRLRLSQRARST